MSANSSLKELARFLIDAFDVDIQLYIGKLMKQLSETPSGLRFAEWAKANPVPFEALLRLISASVQKLPKDKSILLETVSDHLSRLPVEIRRAIIDDGISITSGSKPSLADDNFRARYEQALEGVSDEVLEQIVRLPENKIKEWVYSPARIRPFLLKKWQEELKHKESQQNKDLSQSLSDSFKKLDEAFADDSPLGKWSRDFRKKAEDFRARQRKK